MQQHNFNTLIQKEEQRYNKSKKEEIIPRYRSTSHPYHSNDKENEEFGQRKELEILNF
jgi:O-acetylhomoserine/O-acetylserine sulfhydrylase-like pyridoxal-dependent enzyme